MGRVGLANDALSASLMNTSLNMSYTTEKNIKKHLNMSYTTEIMMKKHLAGYVDI